MWFLYFAGAVLACLIIFGIVLSWKIFISKPKQVEQKSSQPVVSRLDVQTWFVGWLFNWRRGEGISLSTTLTALEVKAALFIAKDKFGLSLEIQEDVWSLEFEGTRTHFCVGQELSTKTVFSFVYLLSEHIELRQNKQKSQVG